MKTLFKIIIIFLVISVVSTILYNYTDIDFGKIDFFSKHGWIFLFSIALFPRLTLLVSGLIVGSIEFGGLLWWLGFFFAPRILVATVATVAYWRTNPFLVVLAWLIALGGESSEKLVISRRMRSAPHKFNTYEGTTIDAEYKVKD
ncbi:MAG: hypothetical protein PHY93_12820 [Bacteriovorax sp.]|nr:hypothetical protein [Bacteriovorax sp.]